MTRPRVPLDRSVCPEVKTVKCFSTEAQTQTAYGSAQTAALGEAPGSALYLPLLLGSLGEGGSEKHRGSHWHRQCGEATPCGLARGRGRLLPSRWALTSLLPQCVPCCISLAREASGTLCGSGPAEGIMSFSPACLSRSHALTCCHGKLYDGPIKQNRKKRRVERAVGFAGPRSPSGLRERSRL